MELSDSQRTTLDERIYGRDILQAIMLIRQWTGASLHECMDIHVERYRELRELHADRFTCSDEDYWDGFRS